MQNPTFEPRKSEKHHIMLHAFARLASFLFHPLLILTYTLVFLLAVNPYLFGVNHLSDPSSKLLLLRVFLSSCFIPGVAILMLRFTGLLRSLEMPSPQDRIGPFVITGMFYLWLFRNFLDNGQIPPLFSSFTLGATITLFLAFLVNIFSKISVHAAGMGGLLGVIVLTLTLYPNYAFTPILPSGSLPFSFWHAWDSFIGYRPGRVGRKRPAIASPSRTDGSLGRVSDGVYRPVHCCKVYPLSGCPLYTLA